MNFDSWFTRKENFHLETKPDFNKFKNYSIETFKNSWLLEFKETIIFTVKSLR